MNNNSSKSGVSIVGVVQIVFIVLKLCNLIDWSWFWVLSPIMFSIILAILLIIILSILKNT